MKLRGVVNATVLKEGLRKRIHVNGAEVRRNKRDKTDRPVFTVKTYNQNVYGTAVRISGPSTLIQRFDKPLASGAVAWIETSAEVLVYA